MRIKGMDKGGRLLVEGGRLEIGCWRLEETREIGRDGGDFIPKPCTFTYEMLGFYLKSGKVG